MKNIVLLFVFLIALFSSCQREQSPPHEAAGIEVDYNETVPATKRSTESANIDGFLDNRKLIKNASLTFETEDLSTTLNTIAQSTNKFGGYISAEVEYREYSRETQRMTVRIPAKNFDLFLADIAKNIAHFDTRSIDVQDVTAQFIDLEARLQTKKELEKRFLVLLKKANSVKDILEIEKEIANLRSDIEVMEGRLRLMKNQISFSTFAIEFYKLQRTESTTFSWKFSHGFKNGWDNLMQFFVGLINIWPFILIAIVVFIILKRKLKTRK